MNNQDYRKLQKKYWPEGSLERCLKLNYPGCKSPLDALAKTLSLKHSHTASQSMEEPLNLEIDTYAAMIKILKDLESFFLINNYELIPLSQREHIARIPIKTLDDAKFWQRELKRSLGEPSGDEATRKTNTEPCTRVVKV